MLTNNTKYAAQEGVLTSTVGDSIFLLDPQEGVYYELNDCGSFLWAKLQDKAHTYHELCSAITQQYEGESMKNFEKEVEDFLCNLKSKNLINQDL